MKNERIDLTGNSDHTPYARPSSPISPEQVVPESGNDAAPLLPDVGDAVFGHGGVNDPSLDFESIFARDEIDNTWANIRSLEDDLIGDGNQHPVNLIFSDLYHNC